jgi:hypothetical protein
MKSGKKMPIELLRHGDIIKTYNGEAKTIFISKIKNNNLVKIGFNDGSCLRTSYGHPLVTSDFTTRCVLPEKSKEMTEVFQLKKLSIGEELLGKKRVSSIQFENKKETVYNLILENDHSFYANDVLVLTPSRGVVGLLAILVDDLEAELSSIPIIKERIIPLKRLLDEKQLFALSELLSSLFKHYIADIGNYKKGTKLFKIFKSVGNAFQKLYYCENDNERIKIVKTLILQQEKLSEKSMSR